MIKIVLLLSSVLLFSCKTSKKNEGLLQGELSDRQALDEQVNSISPSLWSPSQRKAQAQYYYLVGETLFLEGKYSESLGYMDQAYNLDPNAFLGRKLINGRLSAKKSEGILGDIKRMVLLYPKDPDLHVLHGRILLIYKNRSAAIKSFVKALKYDDKNDEAYTFLITAYQEKGETKKAIKIAKEMTKKIPDSFLGWAALSQLYIRQSKIKEALLPAKRAYELQSKNPELLLVYAYTLELNKQKKKALDLYELAFRMNPHNEELIGRMLRLYKETFGLKKALEVLNDLIDSDTKGRTELAIHKVYILWEMEKYPEAVRVLEGLVKANPKDPRIRYMAGLGYEKIKKLNEAINMYEGIEGEKDLQMKAAFRLIVVQRALKKYEAAYESIKSLRELDPENWELYALEAGILNEEKKYSKAVDILNIGIKHFPKKVRLVFLKGMNADLSGDKETCIESMKKVIKMDPMHATAYNYLGYLYAEQGVNLKDAEKLIKRALELKPRNGFYLDSLGWVYYKMGNYKEALNLLSQSLEEIPNEGVVLEHIGDVYYKQKDRAKALESYEKALKSKLEEKDKMRIKGKIQNIEKIQNNE